MCVVPRTLTDITIRGMMFQPHSLMSPIRRLVFIDPQNLLNRAASHTGPLSVEPLHYKFNLQCTVSLPCTPLPYLHSGPLQGYNASLELGNSEFQCSQLKVSPWLSSSLKSMSNDRTYYPLLRQSRQTTSFYRGHLWFSFSSAHGQLQ